jgi:hypothetical protein
MACAVALAACVLGVLMGLAPSLVAARSSGQLSYCDLTPIGDVWPAGKYGKKPGGADSGVMSWTVAPTAASFYTLRAGDGAPANDAKSYTPGQPIELHLRVTDIRKTYIGLVLYATTKLVDGKDNQVGRWEFPAGADFGLPTTCRRTAVTHSNSVIKPIHSRFFFTATAGTGKGQNTHTNQGAS